MQKNSVYKTKIRDSLNKLSTLFNQFISLFNQGVEYIGSFLVSKVYVKISSFHLHALLCLYYIRKNTLSQMCKKIRL